MCKKQKFIVFSLVVFLMMLSYIPSVYAEKDVVGKTFYTTANIWYENPERIYSTNYHRGAIIPVGTKVTIKEIDNDEIRLVDERGMGFTVVYLQKHSAPNTTIWNYFDQYFSEENPMRKGGPFEKFTEKEKNNIKIGEIEEGMSKPAVLMSYGYPPTHRTPSLESDVWVYWTSRMMKRTVYFKDGKVFKIDRGV